MPREDMQAQLITRAVKRHWLLVAVVTVVATVAALAFVSLLPTVYTSTVSILLQPLPGNAFATTATTGGLTTTVAMQTEAGVVDSVEVTARVNAALGTTLKPGSGSVTTTVPASTQIIEISYAAASPTDAQRFAQAYAVAFLAYRSARAATAQQAQLADLTNKATQAGQLLRQALRAAAGPNPAPNVASNVDVYSSRLAALQAQVAQLQSLSGQPGTVVSPAKLPHRPGAAHSVLVILAAAILGLLVGMAGAIWRERRDDRIRSTDPDSTMGLPVLATIPLARADVLSPSGAQVDVAQVEAFRIVRTCLLAAARPHSVIAVSALRTSDASAYVVVQLARALSLAGYRVVLVDAAVGGVQVAPLLGLVQTRGLSDALLGGESGHVALINVEGIRVLPAGSNPGGARDQYSGGGLRSLLAKLREDADFVLVSSSPVTTSDGLALVLAADSIALVVTDRLTTHHEIAVASKQIHRLGAHVLGLVVLRMRKRRGRRSAEVPTVNISDVAQRSGQFTDAAEPAHESNAGMASAPLGAGSDRRPSPEGTHPLAPEGRS